MTQLEYDEITGVLMAEAAHIERLKRPGYTRGAVDVLANFKRAGEQNGISAGAAWGVHFDKHVDAIKAALLHPELPVSEPLLGRFADAVNYLRLGYALYIERETGTREVA